jgi:hypothetical protein
MQPQQSGGVFFVIQPGLAGESLALKTAQAGIWGLAEGMASSLLAYNIHSAVIAIPAQDAQAGVAEVLRRVCAV